MDDDWWMNVFSFWFDSPGEKKRQTITLRLRFIPKSPEVRPCSGVLNRTAIKNTKIANTNCAAMKSFLTMLNIKNHLKMWNQKQSRSTISTLIVSVTNAKNYSIVGTQWCTMRAVITRMEFKSCSAVIHAINHCQQNTCFSGKWIQDTRDKYSAAICAKRISRGKEIFDSIWSRCTHATHTSIAPRWIVQWDSISENCWRDSWPINTVRFAIYTETRSHRNVGFNSTWIQSIRATQCVASEHVLRFPLVKFI